MSSSDTGRTLSWKHGFGHACVAPGEEAPMRQYDDPVEVRKGLVAGASGLVEAPEQFL